MRSPYLRPARTMLNMDDSFEIRSADRPTPAVSPGLSVKVGRRRERFWALVEELSDGVVICKVDNVLVINSDLPRGHTLRLRYDNILESASMDDQTAFITDLLAARLAGVPDGEIAIEWWARRQASGKAVPPCPGTTVFRTRVP